VSVLATDGALARSVAAPDAVIVGKGDQYWADATQTGLAWTDFRKATGSHVFVKRFGGNRIRVDKSGWSGAMGSFAGPHRLVFQQWKSTRRGDVSDLYTYNTLTRTRRVIGSAQSLVDT